MSIKNTISNKSAAFLLFGLVISLAFVQLYQSNNINGVNDEMVNVKEGFELTAANANLLDEIGSLQSVESSLYDMLNSLKSSDALTTETLNTYLNKIENVDNLRVKLYANLINNYEIYQNHVIETSRTAAKIDNATNIVTAAFPSAESLEDERNNTKRYVEVNTYYSKRYNYLTDVVKIIIYICIVMIVLSTLANNGLIPEWLYSWSLVILLVFGLYFLGKKLFLLFNVDNMNFDRYDWHFTPPTPATTTTA
jgi:hypothetical protein